MRHCVKEVDSLFHPKVRWGEDSIFDAPACISGKPRLACGIKGIYCFHQANGADGDQVLLITRQGVIFFYDVCHQPEIVADELFACSGIPSPQGSKGGLLFPGGKRFGESFHFPDGAPETEILWRKIAARSAAHDIPPGT